MGLHSLEVWVEVCRQSLQNPEPVYKKKLFFSQPHLEHETLFYIYDPARDAPLRKSAWEVTLETA